MELGLIDICIFMRCRVVPCSIKALLVRTTRNFLIICFCFLFFLPFGLSPPGGTREHVEHSYVTVNCYLGPDNVNCWREQYVSLYTIRTPVV